MVYLRTQHSPPEGADINPAQFSPLSTQNIHQTRIMHADNSGFSAKGVGEGEEDLD